MKLSSLVLFFCLFVLWGGQTFRHLEVHRQKEQQKDLSLSLFKEQERYRILVAEWAHLNEPSRIEALARKYLHMRPLSPWKILSLSDLKDPPLEEK